MCLKSHASTTLFFANATLGWLDVSQFHFEDICSPNPVPSSSIPGGEMGGSLLW